MSHPVRSPRGRRPRLKVASRRYPWPQRDISGFTWDIMGYLGRSKGFPGWLGEKCRPGGRWHGYAPGNLRGRGGRTILDFGGGAERRQTVCKPGSVRARLSGHETVIPLGRMLPCASCNQPGRMGGNAQAIAPIRSCSRWGLPCRPRYRGRGALLPPRFTLARGANAAGGLFSVALSLGSPPPEVIRHRVSVEPGLSSAWLTPRSDRPTVWPAAFAPVARIAQP